ncbi:malto-oligosyltrehalose synthase [Leekyejoonella antrihumi]|uniref:Malto-oligosyltrehalose synthase n=1 Tax=Leekyejoonella antrihumi TaxID=1660198 RepID=A0A563E8V1_9MICO|nr:malto-oligosyltrehalose synthase [Leekyejoonella antrihumi]TWP38937.1 malto-oligosyltrehalose synthase [Leekyejoonella antrihumi]
MTRPVTGTYRLQLHAGFTFADAAAQVPYLEHLGISHLYLSPVLQAAPGSMHGYDVVDHGRISEDLGGLDGFEHLVETAHRHDLGVVVDVVPNHMAFVAPEHLNAQVWELLRDGRDATSAEWFDIDWKAGGGRIGLPVLGKPVGEAIADGEIRRDLLGGEPILRYFDHEWPLALGSEHVDDIEDLLQRQHYRLASWRDKDEVLNYRRFFEVDELIAVRVEIEEVFDATHALLLDLNHRGLIDGFRIDHPDGLADPAGYLARLRNACSRGTPVWVEKILEHGERLPSSWDCSGTTGYDALQAIQSALVDPDDAQVIDVAWQACGGEPSYDQAVNAAKRQVVASALGPEVDRLTRRARESLPILDPERLRAAVVELLVAGEVYRAYVQPDERIGRAAGERLRVAFAEAVKARPDLHAELDALIPLSVLADDDESATDFGIRLQQTWGPVMAKGVEDTTFYRWHRLTALNEVGSDPSDLAGSSPASLHQWASWNLEHWPDTMTALSTHDTKRGEDVRARILAVAGDPDCWRQLSSAALKAGQDAGIDGPTAHLVWQTLLGVGDISDTRLEEYLEKALREAKQHTAWVDGDPDYEQQVIDFARETASRGALHDLLVDATERNSPAIRATVLGAKLIQLTMPGVPDTYQGSEVLNQALVDPDNRRPVDYARLSALLASPIEESLDAEKLRVTAAALHLRRRRPDAFDGRSSYTPLPSHSEHALGFIRSSEPGRIAAALGRGDPISVATIVTRAPARLVHSGGWQDRAVELDAGVWTDLLTGRVHHSTGLLLCADIFADLPVALLEQTS